MHSTGPTLTYICFAFSPLWMDLYSKGMDEYLCSISETACLVFHIVLEDPTHYRISPIHPSSNCRHKPTGSQWQSLTFANLRSKQHINICPTSSPCYLASSMLNRIALPTHHGDLKIFLADFSYKTTTHKGSARTGTLLREGGMKMRCPCQLTSTTPELPVQHAAIG